MNGAPSLVSISAVIGDRARAEMLTMLMSGHALTATALADAAGVTKQTASAHLRKLEEAKLIQRHAEGRNRYFSIANAETAEVLEGIIWLAARSSYGSGPTDPELRRARVCYDHLAGEWGVAIYKALYTQGALQFGEGQLRLSDRGEALVRVLEIDPVALGARRRLMCRVCLDWSESTYHLAGAVGAALFERLVELQWLKRTEGSRVVHISPTGARRLRELLKLR